MVASKWVLPSGQDLRAVPANAKQFDLCDSFSYPLFLGLKVVDLVKDPGIPRGLTTSTTLILMWRTHFNCTGRNNLPNSAISAMVTRLIGQLVTSISGTLATTGISNIFWVGVDRETRHHLPGDETPILPRLPGDETLLP